MTQPRILFVDDEKDIAAIAAETLEPAGYDVLTAIDSDIALILMEEGVAFDLLITDIVLPGLLDGFALARHALRLMPRIRVVYSTGFGGVARIRSRGAPYGEVLEKPWRSGTLLKTVRLALEAGARAPTSFGAAPALSESRSAP
jgi:DNA-binding NtrC family response regulator